MRKKDLWAAKVLCFWLDVRIFNNVPLVVLLAEFSVGMRGANYVTLSERDDAILVKRCGIVDR